MDASALLNLHEQDKYQSTEVERPIALDVDLGHLAVFDINNIDNLTTEDELRANTRDCVQALVNALWNQPTRVSDDHTCILASLPDPVYRLPREKPVPKPKTMTRWEKFAQEKNIQKTKRSRLVFDEETKDWIPRHGYKGATQKEDWLIEVPENADPYEDQFEKKREVKKARVDKNKKQQQRNMDISDATEKGMSAAEVRNQRKIQIKSTLKTTGKSTASMGKFDKPLDTKGAVKGIK